MLRQLSKLVRHTSNFQGRLVHAQLPWHATRHFSSQNSRHVIAALVVNQPGCLAQIANLFAARGYNIDSLVVGRTEVPELSRMTVVVNGTTQSVANMKKQLEDIVHVAIVNILSGSPASDGSAPCIERDLMLAKVSTSAPGARAEIIELTNLFDAKILDVRPQQVMVQLAGNPSRIESFIDLLKPMGVVEIHRSGVIAMAKGKSNDHEYDEVSLQGATRSIMDDVDATALPPG